MTWVLSKWLSLLAQVARRKGSAEAVPTSAADEPVRLQKLTVCNVRRLVPSHEPGASRKLKDIGPFKLIADAMGKNLLLAATPAFFLPDEKVLLEMLLQGAGNLKVEGKVDWQLDSHTGRRVQISFQPDAEQRALIDRFLALQKVGLRGTCRGPRP